MPAIPRISCSARGESGLRSRACRYRIADSGHCHTIRHRQITKAPAANTSNPRSSTPEFTRNASFRNHANVHTTSYDGDMESASRKAKKNKRAAHSVPAPSSFGPTSGRGFLKYKANLYPGWDSPEEDKKIEDMFEDLHGTGPEWTAIHDILKSEKPGSGSHGIARRNSENLIFKYSRS
jgi:hypothetical protein